MRVRDTDHGSAPWLPAVQSGLHEACPGATPGVREVVRAQCTLCFGAGHRCKVVLFLRPSHFLNHLTMVCEIFKKAFSTPMYPSPNYECHC